MRGGGCWGWGGGFVFFWGGVGLWVVGGGGGGVGGGGVFCWLWGVGGGFGGFFCFFFVGLVWFIRLSFFRERRTRIKCLVDNLFFSRPLPRGRGLKTLRDLFWLITILLVDPSLPGNH